MRYAAGVWPFNANPRRFDFLSHVARTAAARAQSDDGIRQLLEEVVNFLGADRGTLYRVDPATGELWSRWLLGAEGLEIRVAVGKGLAGWVAMTRVPLVINDVLRDDRFDSRWDKKSGYRTENVLAVPMLDAESALTGVIQVLNKPYGFDDRDRELLEGVAAIGSLALAQYGTGKPGSPTPTA